MRQAEEGSRPRSHPRRERSDHRPLAAGEPYLEIALANQTAGELAVMGHGKADDLGFPAFKGLKQLVDRRLLLVGELDARSDRELHLDLTCSRRLDDPLVPLLVRHLPPPSSLAYMTIPAAPCYTRRPLSRASVAGVLTGVRAALVLADIVDRRIVRLIRPGI